LPGRPMLARFPTFKVAGMSTYESALKKQIELLQGEVELYANALDRLAAQLAGKRQGEAVQGV